MLKLFEDSVGRFYYTYLDGYVLIVSPSLVEEHLGEPVIWFNKRCSVKFSGQFIILSKDDSDMYDIYFLENEYIGGVSGNVKLFLQDGYDDDNEFVILFVPVTETVIIESGDTKFGEWENYKIVLQNGEVEYKYQE